MQFRSTGFNYFLYLSLPFLLVQCVTPDEQNFNWTAAVLKDSTLLLADQNLAAAPITVTASICPRSVGGKHDFYSEGDYWWPDSMQVDSPYIRKDGLTNPANFTDHRQALIRLSEIVGNLGSAYLLTKDPIYAEAAMQHLRAWFVEEETKMSPHLLYAQAIKGRHTGRGIGIIDAIHFMEVVQTVRVLEAAQKISTEDLLAIKTWFSSFLDWLTTHPYGKAEMIHPNNHGTCWNMQVGLYAVFTGNDKVLAACRSNYKNNLLPNQMGIDGSFPLELERTKPYGYALFNLDAMTMNCLVLSDEQNDLWSYQTKDGKTLYSALEYMRPYVADKSSWPLEPDVMYWDNWPVAHPSFLFGGFHFGEQTYLELWENNQHFLEIPEVKRNLPIRNPLLWLTPN